MYSRVKRIHTRYTLRKRRSAHRSRRHAPHTARQPPRRRTTSIIPQPPLIASLLHAAALPKILKKEGKHTKISVYFTPLPEGVHGAVFLDRKDPGAFFVLCNSTEKAITRRHAFGHELAHIFLGHFDTAATLDINTAGSAAKVSYQGEEIRKGDPTPLHFNKEPCELEANAAAWSYYRKYKLAFADAEDKGQAYLEV